MINHFARLAGESGPLANVYGGLNERLENGSWSTAAEEFLLRQDNIVYGGTR